MNNCITPNPQVTEFYLVNFLKKSGKIRHLMHAKVSSVLRLWALQNTHKSTDSIVFNSDTGEVIFYAEGNREGMPNIIKDNLGNIERYCPGMLKLIAERKNNENN